MKILSIIIPSYNTERFLKRNIVFFLDERLLDDLDILIINDGSTDNTGAVAKDLEKRYPQTIRVISKENGGHGSVINLGISLASGKYFKVVDGDDWVNKEGLYALVKYLKNTNIELVINPYNRVYESKGYKTKKFEIRNIKHNIEFIFDDVIKQINGSISLHMWTIRTDILRKNHIKLTEKCYYEDFEYVLFPIPYIHNVIFLDNIVYQYLVNQKNQSISDKNVLKNVDMHYRIIQESIQFYNRVIIENDLNDVKRKYIYKSILELIRTHYNIYLRNYHNKNSYVKMKSFDKELKKLSDTFYFEVGYKNFYIRLLRKHGKLIFYVASILLKVAKSIQ